MKAASQGNPRFRLSHLIPGVLALAFIPMILAVFLTVRSFERDRALEEARATAQRIIERNLSIHSYFSKELKPAVFELAGGRLPENYFDPAWMSSTYAIRKMRESHDLANAAGYYYKECAVNARSPSNEADQFEREFLLKASENPSMVEWVGVREFEGKPFYVIMRRGETMEEGCLFCHSDPAKAPAGLVEKFGSKRSFGRKAGDLVSAMSVRVPLDLAFESAKESGRKLVIEISLITAATLLGLFFLMRFYFERPLSNLRDRVLQTSSDDSLLGVPIETGANREIQDVADAFSQMSGRVRGQIANLEEEVARRTFHLEEAKTALQLNADEIEKQNAQLQEALAQIKTMRGIIPICACCKKIRDDQGYWNQVEAYVSRFTEAQFSHGICPDCTNKLYPDLADDS